MESNTFDTCSGNPVCQSLQCSQRHRQVVLKTIWILFYNTSLSSCSSIIRPRIFQVGQIQLSVYQNSWVSLWIIFSHDRNWLIQRERALRTRSVNLRLRPLLICFQVHCAVKCREWQWMTKKINLLKMLWFTCFDVIASCLDVLMYHAPWTVLHIAQRLRLLPRYEKGVAESVQAVPESEEDDRQTAPAGERLDFQSLSLDTDTIYWFINPETWRRRSSASSTWFYCGNIATHQLRTGTQIDSWYGV